MSSTVSESGPDDDNSNLNVIHGQYKIDLTGARFAFKTSGNAGFGVFEACTHTAVTAPGMNISLRIIMRGPFTVIFQGVFYVQKTPVFRSNTGYRNGSRSSGR
jgi:hypothetical protein